MTSVAMHCHVAQILGWTPTAADWAALEAAVWEARHTREGHTPMTMEEQLMRLDQRVRVVRWLAGVNLGLTLLIAVLVFVR